VDCPACNKPVTQSPAPGGGVTFFCTHCGWGGIPSSVTPTKSERPAIWKVLLLWIVAIVIVVGPYLALMFGIPELMDVGPAAFDEAADRILALVRFNYWWVLAIYLFISVVFTPTYDSDRVGFFGGFIDNPFSFEDDWERQKRAWLFMLLPGKTVWVAIVMTKRLIVPR
jgi:hypothetical protein